MSEAVIGVAVRSSPRVGRVANSWLEPFSHKRAQNEALPGTWQMEKEKDKGKAERREEQREREEKGGK